MSRGLAGVCVFFVLCGAQAGCAPRTRAKAPPLINPRAITQPKTTWAAPSWVARFAAPTQLTTCVTVEQSRLCVGEFGERWLEGPAGAILQETLGAVLDLGPEFVALHGTWLFRDDQNIKVAEVAAHRVLHPIAAGVAAEKNDHLDVDLAANQFDQRSGLAGR